MASEGKKGFSESCLISEKFSHGSSSRYRRIFIFVPDTKPTAHAKNNILSVAQERVAESKKGS
jgi:hypothetical protein